MNYPETDIHAGFRLTDYLIDILKITGPLSNDQLDKFQRLIDIQKLKLENIELRRQHFESLAQNFNNNRHGVPSQQQRQNETQCFCEMSNENDGERLLKAATTLQDLLPKYFPPHGATQVRETGTQTSAKSFSNGFTQTEDFDPTVTFVEKMYLVLVTAARNIGAQRTEGIEKFLGCCLEELGKIQPVDNYKIVSEHEFDRFKLGMSNVFKSALLMMLDMRMCTGNDITDHDDQSLHMETVMEVIDEMVCREVEENDYLQDINHSPTERDPIKDVQEFLNLTSLTSNHSLNIDDPNKKEKLKTRKSKSMHKGNHVEMTPSVGVKDVNGYGDVYEFLPVVYENDRYPKLEETDNCENIIYQTHAQKAHPRDQSVNKYMENDKMMNDMYMGDGSHTDDWCTDTSSFTGSSSSSDIVPPPMIRSDDDINDCEIDAYDEEVIAIPTQKSLESRNNGGHTSNMVVKSYDRSIYSSSESMQMNMNSDSDSFFMTSSSNSFDDITKQNGLDKKDHFKTKSANNKATEVLEEDKSEDRFIRGCINNIVKNLESEQNLPRIGKEVDKEKQTENMLAVKDENLPNQQRDASPTSLMKKEFNKSAIQINNLETASSMLRVDPNVNVDKCHGKTDRKPLKFEKEQNNLDIGEERMQSHEERTNKDVLAKEEKISSPTVDKLHSTNEDNPIAYDDKLDVISKTNKETSNLRAEIDTERSINVLCALIISDGYCSDTSDDKNVTNTSARDVDGLQPASFYSLANDFSHQEQEMNLPALDLQKLGLLEQIDNGKSTYDPSGYVNGLSLTNETVRPHVDHYDTKHVQEANYQEEGESTLALLIEK